MPGSPQPSKTDFDAGECPNHQDQRGSFILVPADPLEDGHAERHDISQQQGILRLCRIDNPVMDPPLSATPRVAFGVIIICTFAAGLDGPAEGFQQHADRACRLDGMKDGCESLQIVEKDMLPVLIGAPLDGCGRVYSLTEAPLAVASFSRTSVPPVSFMAISACSFNSACDRGRPSMRTTSRCKTSQPTMARISDDPSTTNSVRKLNWIRGRWGGGATGSGVAELSMFGLYPVYALHRMLPSGSHGMAGTGGPLIHQRGVPLSAGLRLTCHLAYLVFFAPRRVKLTITVKAYFPVLSSPCPLFVRYRMGNNRY